MKRKFFLLSIIFCTLFLGLANADHTITPSIDPEFQKTSDSGINVKAVINNDITSQNRIMAVSIYAPQGYSITTCKALAGWRIGNSNSRYCSYVTNGASISPGNSAIFELVVSTPSAEDYYDWTFDTIDDSWSMDSKTFTTFTDGTAPTGTIITPLPFQVFGPNEPFDVFLDAEERGLIKSGLWNTGFIVFKSGPANFLIGTFDFTGTPERGLYSGKSFFSGTGPVYFLPGTPEGSGEIEVTIADSAMNYYSTSVPIIFSRNITKKSSSNRISVK
jgi:uncharacterized protein YcnI